MDIFFGILAYLAFGWFYCHSRYDYESRTFQSAATLVWPICFIASVVHGVRQPYMKILIPIALLLGILFCDNPLLFMAIGVVLVAVGILWMRRRG